MIHFERLPYNWHMLHLRICIKSRSRIYTLSLECRTWNISRNWVDIANVATQTILIKEASVDTWLYQRFYFSANTKIKAGNNANAIRASERSVKTFIIIFVIQTIIFSIGEHDWSRGCDLRLMISMCTCAPALGLQQGQIK